MAALAVGDEQPLLARMHITQSQPEHLAASQPAQQHRLHHRPVPMGAQRPYQGVGLLWVDHPCGTGFLETTPRTIRYSNSPVTEASRRLIVRADKPASPSWIRTTSAPRLGCRWAAMNDNTSAPVTSSGTLATCVKNTFRSNAVASTVFGRARAATISR